jgi:hypothetical protein
MKGVWVNEQCRMHVGRETEVFVKKELIVSCLALFSPYMMPGQASVLYLDRYSILIFRWSRKRNLRCPRAVWSTWRTLSAKFFGALPTDRHFCMSSSTYTHKAFSMFLRKDYLPYFPNLVCPHEMNCWFICIPRHPMSSALVPLSDLSSNSTYCNTDISFLLFYSSASFQHVPFSRCN